MMRLPKSIVVAGHTIKIVHKSGLTLDGEECWGVYDDGSKTIYLRNGMDDSRKSEIFLHECIHAIDYIHVLGLSEKSVKILGIEILALLKNNRINIKTMKGE